MGGPRRLAEWRSRLICGARVWELRARWTMPFRDGLGQIEGLMRMVVFGVGRPCCRQGRSDCVATGSDDGRPEAQAQRYDEDDGGGDDDNSDDDIAWPTTRQRRTALPRRTPSEMGCGAPNCIVANAV